MALDKLVDSSQLNGALTSTANAIRAKTGGADPLTWDMNDGFETAVSGILTPTDGSIPTKNSSNLTVSGATVTTPAGYYAENATKTIANGTVVNNTSGGTSSGTINFGKQIKIGTGYYANDTYYTAQAPSGNIQLTQSTSTDVSAYATATVRSAVFPNMSGGGLSGTATVSSSTASISDSTNNSGISLVTACNATRAKISCVTSTAGWANGTVKELAETTTALTTKTYYINGVTLTAPSSGERTFIVNTPAGNFKFHVDSSSNVTVTEA